MWHFSVNSITFIQRGGNHEKQLNPGLHDGAVASVKNSPRMSLVTEAFLRGVFMFSLCIFSRPTGFISQFKGVLEGDCKMV